MHNVVELFQILVVVVYVIMQFYYLMHRMSLLHTLISLTASVNKLSPSRLIVLTIQTQQQEIIPLPPVRAEQLQETTESEEPRADGFTQTPEHGAG